MHYLILILIGLTWGCNANSTNTIVDVRPDSACDGLFGVPNEQSGFDRNACTPQCECADSAMTRSDIRLDSPLFEAIHANPVMPPETDPYSSEDTMPSPNVADLVCAIEISSDRQSYTLTTVNRTEADPYAVTHTGPCGLCSSLQDFRVYATQTDLTDPVRMCGFMGISSGMEANIACLKNIGFSSNCALIWYYNTLNTRTECLDECLAHLNSPYVDETGQLNPCLQCDELKSGPIFKHVSGRTRRNSAIPSAICRPCSSVSTLTHSYLIE